MEVLADLLQAEAAHRHAASIRYRMTAARLPVIKDLGAFVFDGTPINEGLVRQLHAGSFLPNRRNIVLVGGTGTGKTHLAIAITAAVVRAGRASLLQLFVRSIFLVLVPPLSLIVGFITMMVSPYRQRVGDHMAKTVVIRA